MENLLHRVFEKFSRVNAYKMLRTVFLKLQITSESSRGLAKTQIAWLHPQIFSFYKFGGRIICISNNFPGYAVDDQGNHWNRTMYGIEC